MMRETHICFDEIACMKRSTIGFMCFEIESFVRGDVEIFVPGGRSSRRAEKTEERGKTEEGTGHSTSYVNLQRLFW